MKIFLTVIVVEHLAGIGKERLDVLPNPRSPIADHTKSNLIFGYQARFFDLLEGVPQLFLVLHLMPAQHMDNALVIDQIKPKALGIAPLATPRGASPPRVPRPRWALPSPFGPRGHVPPIDAQPHPRPAKAACRH